MSVTTAGFLRRMQCGAFWLFMLDLLLLGAGRNVPGLDFSTRKIFFALFAVLSVMTFAANFRSRRVLDAALICCTVIFLLVWVILIPIYTHGNLGYAVTDATPLVATAIFLLTTDFTESRAAWHHIRQFLMVFVIAFGVLHICLYLLFRIMPEMREPVTQWMQAVLDIGIGDEARFVFFTPLDGGVFRIYFGSSFLLLLGFYFAAAASERTGNWSWRQGLPLVALILLAMWATNTRSLFLGVGAFLFVYVLALGYLKLMTKPSYASVFVALALPFFCSFLLIPTVDPSVLQVFGLSRDISDDVRAEQFGPLLDALGSSPVVGLGFGSNASFIRAEDAPYAYELSIVALFMKIGIGGLLLACGIWAGALRAFPANSEVHAGRKKAALYALYFSFVFSCFYNPYVFGFFGTFFLLFVLYEFSSVVRGTQ